MSQNRTEELCQVAREFIPQFEGRYDYSQADHYDSMIEQAFKAAEAFLKKKDKVMEEARPKVAKEVENAKEAAQ